MSAPARLTGALPPPGLLASHAPLRTTTPRTLLPHTQRRAATLLRRPHRPYQFTQLMTLSDGSTYVHRTTSPVPVYRSNRDTRNTALWNPSNQKLANVEEDEAGRLRAFRRRFGRGWDAEMNPAVLGQETGAGDAGEVEVGLKDGEKQARKKVVEDVGEADSWSEEGEDNLMDLISSYGQESAQRGEAKGSQQEARNSGKGKGGQR